MNAVDTVLFDWDGTLINSAQAAFDAFQKSMSSLGISINFELYAGIYSPDWRRMYGALGLPLEKWAEAEDLWTGYYGDNVPDMVPGANEVLRALRQQGYGLGIVSSGTGGRVRREINACGLEELFKVVVCGEDVRNSKPHPEGLETAMKAMDRAPEACCYVGDNPDDMAMGQRARVRTIGIPGNYPGSGKLKNLRPDYVLRSIREMIPIFDACRVGAD